MEAFVGDVLTIVKDSEEGSLGGSGMVTYPPQHVLVLLVQSVTSQLEFETKMTDVVPGELLYQEAGGKDLEDAEELHHVLGELLEGGHVPDEVGHIMGLHHGGHQDRQVHVLDQIRFVARQDQEASGSHGVANKG